MHAHNFKILIKVNVLAVLCVQYRGKNSNNYTHTHIKHGHLYIFRCVKHKNGHFQMFIYF